MGSTLCSSGTRARSARISRRTGITPTGSPICAWRCIPVKALHGGFHRRLVQLTLREARARPLRPVPVLRW